MSRLGEILKPIVRLKITGEQAEKGKRLGENKISLSNDFVSPFH